MITIADMIACATAELHKRRAAYPRLVEIRRMTQAACDREIAVQAEIVRFLEAKKAKGAP
jgi:hypothetical protein